MPRPSLPSLLEDIRACSICEAHLPHGVRPVLQAAESARILIAGQAPGRRVHETGVPFDDPSGDRLREWMGLSRDAFYDANQIAILPMGFCFPGTGASGDLPPRPECAAEWRKPLLERLPELRLTLVIGQYAMKWHLDSGSASLTAMVRDWQRFAPDHLPLPHPSPRNNIWLKKNPWFAEQVLPDLRERVATALAD